MLKIWGRRNSSNVKKVLWCAEEMKLPHEQIDAGGAFGGTDNAEYRALNPNGLVPTIKDGDFVLWESNSIIRYLATKHGNEALYPTELKQRATVEQWMDWIATSFAVPFRDILFNLLRLPEPERDMKVANAAVIRLSTLLTLADAQLAKTPYLGGTNFSLADITFGPYVYGLLEMDLKLPALPHVRAWYERMKQRPAFAKTVMLPLT